MCEVSIIIPVYNVEKYLRECLESVLQQKSIDIEVICVEDASKDKSLQILKELEGQDSRVRIVCNSDNRGLSYARNRGLQEATGKYIMFVDSDDMLKENAIAELYNVMLTHNVDGILFDMETQLEGESAKEKWKNLKTPPDYCTENQLMSGKELFVQFYQGNNWKIEAWRYFWRREFLVNNNLKFYDGLVHEDNLFSFCCLMKAERMIYINKKYYVYRRRDNSLMTTLTYRHIESLFLIFNEIYNQWKRQEASQKLDLAVEKYLDGIYMGFQKKKKYFSEYQPLSIGNVADRYMFQKLFGVNDNKMRKYAFLGKEKLTKLKDAEKIFVYGAGTAGIETIELLEENKLTADAVLVTNKDINMEQVSGYDICNADEALEKNKNAVVIVAVTKRFQNEIVEKLNMLGVKNIMLLDEMTTE